MQINSNLSMLPSLNKVPKKSINETPLVQIPSKEREEDQIGNTNSSTKIKEHFISDKDKSSVKQLVIDTVRNFFKLPSIKEQEQDKQLLSEHHPQVYHTYNQSTHASNNDSRDQLISPHIKKKSKKDKIKRLDLSVSQDLDSKRKQSNLIKKQNGKDIAEIKLKKKKNDDQLKIAEMFVSDSSNKEDERINFKNENINKYKHSINQNKSTYNDQCNSQLSLRQNDMLKK